jgi:hypothetical protein
MIFLMVMDLIMALQKLWTYINHKSLHLLPLSVDATFLPVFLRGPERSPRPWWSFQCSQHMPRPFLAVNLGISMTSDYYWHYRWLLVTLSVTIIGDYISDYMNSLYEWQFYSIYYNFYIIYIINFTNVMSLAACHALTPVATVPLNLVFTVLVDGTLHHWNFAGTGYRWSCFMN